MNLSQKLISVHSIEGQLVPGTEIALHVDQALSHAARSNSHRITSAIYRSQYHLRRL